MRHDQSLPARGVWIEIDVSPQTGNAGEVSLPARGVWIEMGQVTIFTSFCSSLPARGVWIEMTSSAGPTAVTASLPARGVWIEIRNSRKNHRHPTVTPREGSVD